LFEYYILYSVYGAHPLHNWNNRRQRK